MSQNTVALPPVSEEVVTATVTGAALDAPITWISSAPSIATVRDDGPFGIITGVSEGTTTVYAVLVENREIKSPPITVTVARVAALTGITVDSAVQQLIVGDTRTVTPTPVRAASRATVTYQFTSSNPSVATVNATSGVVTAIGPGNATITVAATATGAGLITNTLSATTQVVVATIATRAPRITAGRWHTCALRTTGRAVCWGWNAFGQLGDGTMTTRFAPTEVAGNLSFMEISAGYQHTCGLTATGSAYCWGDGSAGRLGTGDTTTRTAPARVSSSTPFTILEVGGSHSCALTATGSANCWGWNLTYQLGDLTQTSRSAPVAVQVPGVTFRTLAGGLNDTCGLTTTNALYCWGMFSGNAPTLQEGGAVYAAVAAGRRVKCALSTRGQLACWGGTPAQNLNGVSKTGTSPQAFVVGHVFRSLAAGDDHVCALTVANDAYCWGSAENGQLGGSGITATSLLRPVSGGLKFIELAAGEQHTCGLTTNGLVYCWGSNNSGQLGVTGPTSLMPQLVPFTP